MKRVLFGVAVLLGVGLISLAGRSDEPKQPDKKPEVQKADRGKVHALMMRKLELSQKILEALTQNDKKTIEKNANELVQITKEADWKVFKTKEFESFSGEFRRSAEQLAKNAKDNNLDSASLTYLELTLSCFNCHKYMRDQH